MKEHEHPYWKDLTVHHEGGPRSAAHKQVKQIVSEHGGTYDTYHHLAPEKVTEVYHTMPNEKSYKKAAGAIRKAGHMVEGVDY